MSALSLWRSPGLGLATLRRLQEAGKPAKVIRIANAVLREQTPFGAARKG